MGFMDDKSALLLSLVGPAAGGAVGAIVRGFGWPRVALVTCLLFVVATALQLGIQLSSKDSASALPCLLLVWSAFLSCAWWLYAGYAPLAFLLALFCCVLGLTSRNDPQHQSVVWMGRASLWILSGGFFGRFSDQNEVLHQ